MYIEEELCSVLGYRQNPHHFDELFMRLSLYCLLQGWAYILGKP